MKINFNKASALLKASLFLFLLLASGYSVRAQEKSLMAISNQTGAPASLKLSELKAVLNGEKDRWKSGNRVILALMKTNTPLGKQVAETVYDMSGDQLNRFWLGLVFQGKAQAPNFFSSLAELEKFVAENPGAIGISNRNPASEEIRVIQIDGEKTF
jgi:hypothetical protein